MQVVELIVYSFFLYLFFTSVFVPLGYLLCSRLLGELTESYKLLLSFAFSALFYAVVIVFALIFGLSNTIIQLLLLGLILTAFFIFIYNRYHLKVFSSNRRFIFCFCFLYWLLTLFVSAYPNLDLRSIEGFTTMGLTNLPVDNVIPYNISRYIVERIDPNAYQVVPTWKFSDRTPLAGILSSGVFIILGLEETASWAQASPTLYYVYQSFLSYLNLLALFALFLIVDSISGRKAATYSLILAAATYSIFLNVLFSWPKFFMVYLFLAAFTVYLAFDQTNRKKYFYAGVFSAAAILAHESIMFSVAAFCCYVLLDRFSVKKISQFIFYFTGLLLFYSPWLYFRTFISSSSNKGQFFHLFCYFGNDTEKIQPSEMLTWYLGENTWQQILSARLGNLFYPFDPSVLFDVFYNFSDSIFVLFNRMQQPAFFQLIAGLGLPLVILLLYFFLLGFKDKELKKFLPYVVVTYASLIFAGLSAGCEKATILHSVGYAPFIASFLVFGPILLRAKFTGQIFLLLGLLSNLLITILTVHYHAQLKPFLHGSVTYFSSQALLTFVIFIYAFYHAEKKTDGQV